MLNGLIIRTKANYMSKLLPNQVYAGLFEIIKNEKFYHHSRVGTDYCHLTDKGKEEVIKWIDTLAPYMIKLEQDEFTTRAKNMLWDELKK